MKKNIIYIIMIMQLILVSCGSGTNKRFVEYNKNVENDYFYSFYYSYNLQENDYPDEEDINKFVDDIFRKKDDLTKKGSVQIYIGDGDDDDKKNIAFAFKDDIKGLKNISYTDEAMYKYIKGIN